MAAPNGVTMNKKALYPILVLTAGLAAAALIGTSERDITPEPHEPMATTVRVTRVQAAPEYLSIASQGTVQPRSQSELIPEVSGRVIWTADALVSGGAFRQGEALLRIDDSDYQTLLARGEASRKRSEAEHGHARDEL